MFSFLKADPLAHALQRREWGEIQAELLERLDGVERIIRVCLHICKLELDEIIGLV
jgi:hypothetical protein